MKRIERIVLRHQIAAAVQAQLAPVGPRRADGHERGSELTTAVWPPHVTTRTSHERMPLPTLAALEGGSPNV